MEFEFLDAWPVFLLAYVNWEAGEVVIKHTTHDVPFTRAMQLESYKASTQPLWITAVVVQRPVLSRLCTLDFLEMATPQQRVQWSTRGIRIDCADE